MQKKQSKNLISFVLDIIYWISRISKFLPQIRVLRPEKTTGTKFFENKIFNLGLV